MCILSSGGTKASIIMIKELMIHISRFGQNTQVLYMGILWTVFQISKRLIFSLIKLQIIKLNLSMTLEQIYFCWISKWPTTITKLRLNKQSSYMFICSQYQFRFFPVLHFTIVIKCCNICICNFIMCASRSCLLLVYMFS